MIKFTCKLCHTTFSTEYSMYDIPIIAKMCAFCRFVIVPSHIPESQEVQYLNMRHRKKDVLEEDRQKIADIREKNNDSFGRLGKLMNNLLQ